MPSKSAHYQVDDLLYLPSSSIAFVVTDIVIDEEPIYRGRPCDPDNGEEQEHANIFAKQSDVYRLERGRNRNRRRILTQHVDNFSVRSAEDAYRAVEKVVAAYRRLAECFETEEITQRATEAEVGLRALWSLAQAK